MTDLSQRLERLPVRMGVPQYMQVTMVNYLEDSDNTVDTVFTAYVSDMGMHQIKQYVPESEVYATQDFLSLTINANVSYEPMFDATFFSMRIGSYYYRPLSVQRGSMLVNYKLIVKREYD